MVGGMSCWRGGRVLTEDGRELEDLIITNGWLAGSHAPGLHGLVRCGQV